MNLLCLVTTQRHHNDNTTTTQHIRRQELLCCRCVVVVVWLWCRCIVNQLLLCCGSLGESWNIRATVHPTSVSRAFICLFTFFFLILTSLWRCCSILFVALLIPFSYEDKRLASIEQCTIMTNSLTSGIHESKHVCAEGGHFKHMT